MSKTKADQVSDWLAMGQGIIEGLRVERESLIARVAEIDRKIETLRVVVRCDGELPSPVLAPPSIPELAVAILREHGPLHAKRVGDLVRWKRPGTSDRSTASVLSNLVAEGILVSRKGPGKWLIYEVNDKPSCRRSGATVPRRPA